MRRKFIEAEDVLDEVVEFTHSRDSIEQDMESSMSDGTPSKTVINVTPLGSDYKSYKLPHVVQATKATLEHANADSSQKAEVKTMPEVKTVKSGSTPASKGKTTAAEVISGKGARKENDDRTPGEAENVNSSGLSPNSQRSLKNQISNPISPGACVPERRPSFNKSVSSEKCQSNSQAKSVRVEKTNTKPKHESRNKFQSNKGTQ